MDSEANKNQEINRGSAVIMENEESQNSHSNVGRIRLPEGVILNLKASPDRPIESSTIKTKPKVDFSIEAILSSRPSVSSTIVVNSSEIFSSESKSNTINNRNDPQFSWVYCTRYRPPKLPRAKREMNLRNRYRNPRIPFSTTEVGALERKFLQSPYLGSNDVNELAAALNMSPKRVKIWFQNRRARERREREVE